MLEAVAYLHSIDLCHTDLKPENILAAGMDYVKAEETHASLGRRVPSNAGIRVIDFGSATFADQYHSSVVSTRHYRAPEIVLGLGWSYPCDIWSIGCILVELVTGDALYQTHDNVEHLAMMERTLGKIPTSMVRDAHGDTRKYFHKERHTLLWPDKAKNTRSVRAVSNLNSVSSMLRKRGDPVLSQHPHIMNTLSDFVERMLDYRPHKRISAVEALNHPFFQVEIPLAKDFVNIVPVDYKNIDKMRVLHASVAAASIAEAGEAQTTQAEGGRRGGDHHTRGDGNTTTTANTTTTTTGVDGGVVAEIMVTGGLANGTAATTAATKGGNTRKRERREKEEEEEEDHHRGHDEDDGNQLCSATAADAQGKAERDKDKGVLQTEGAEEERAEDDGRGSSPKRRRTLRRAGQENHPE